MCSDVTKANFSFEQNFSVPMCFLEDINISGVI